MRSQSWVDLNCAQKRLLELFLFLDIPSVSSIFKVRYQYVYIFIVVIVRFEVLAAVSRILKTIQLWLSARKHIHSSVWLLLGMVVAGDSSRRRKFKELVVLIWAERGLPVMAHT